MAAVPSGGWGAAISGRLRLFQGGSLVIVCLLLALGFLVASRQKFLAQVIDERTRELEQELAQRKQKELELLESEERYRSFFNQSIDAVLLTSPDGRILQANPEACRIFSRTEEEIRQVGRAGVIDSSDSRLAHAIEERTRTGRFKGELTFRRKDGNSFPGEISSAVFADRDGNLRTSMIIRDITERKQAEAARIASENRFRRFLERAPLPICHVDQNGVITFRNERFIEIFGYTQEDVPTLAEWWRSAYPDTDYRRWVMETWDVAVRRAADKGTDIEPVEYRVACKNGEQRIVEISGITMGEDFFATFIDLTDRKRAEADLLKERDFSDTVIDSLPGIFYMYNEQRRFLRWNRNFESLSGYSGGEIARMSPLNFFAGPEKNLLDEKIKEVFRNGAAEVEADFLSKDGTRTPCFFSGLTLKINDELYLIGVGIDITERRAAEIALRQTEGRLKLFIEHAPASLAMFDREMCYLAASRRWLDDYSLGDRDLYGLCHYDVFPEIGEDWKAIHRRAMAGEVVRSEEDRFVRADGRVQWLRWEVRPWHADGGVGGIVVFSEDITTRKKAEESILLLNNRLQYLIEVIQLLSRAQSLEEIAAAVRTAARKLVGADGATFVLRDNDHCFYMDEDAIAPLWKGSRFPMERCISGWAMLHRETVVIEDIYQDDRIPHELYRQTFVKSLTILPIHTEDPYGAIGVYWAERNRPDEDELLLIQTLANTTAIAMENIRAYRDLETRVRERTHELAEANIRLQEMDRLKSLFIASMSHELRTPLNSIIGFTGIILMGMSGEISDLQKKQLGMVKKSANHLLELINDVIDVSKIEAGKTDLTIESFDLSELAREVEEVFDVAASDKGLELSLHSEDHLQVTSDRRRVRQILVNLVGNAVKFTARGSVTVVMERAGAGIQVRVRDTGVGIRKEDMGRLFQPFSRIYIQGRPVVEGTGLGLYLSQRIVALLGGTIIAESECGQGSTFILTLPVQHPEVQS